jgi:hypothetical protein
MNRKYKATVETSGVTLTAEQRTAIDKLEACDRYVGFSNAFPLLGCGDCIMVQCWYPSGNTITLGIESDGYVHS